jgi:hypothetical protein
LAWCRAAAARLIPDIGIISAKKYLQSLLSLAPMPVCRKTSHHDQRIAQDGIAFESAAG